MLSEILYAAPITLAVGPRRRDHLDADRHVRRRDRRLLRRLDGSPADGPRRLGAGAAVHPDRDRDRLAARQARVGLAARARERADPRDRRPRLGRHLAHRAEPGADAARARLREPRARARLARSHDHAAAHPARRDPPGARERRAVRLDLGARRDDPLVPRPRRSDELLVGPDAQLGLQLGRDDGRQVGLLPAAGHLRDAARDVLQPLGQRARGGRQPERPAGARPDGGRPDHRRRCSRSRSCASGTATAGSDRADRRRRQLLVAPRRGARARGRVGLRQDDHRARAARAAAERAAAHRRRDDAELDARRHAPPPAHAERLARRALADRLDRLPGRDERPRPGHAHRPADRRGDPPARAGGRHRGSASASCSSASASRARGARSTPTSSRAACASA